MIAFTTTLRRALVSTVAFTVSLGTVGQAIAQTTTLNGAGATFPAPLYQRYFSDYQKAKSVTVNYNSIGSGAGIQQFIGGTVDFGASDVAPSAADKAKMKNGLVLVPTAGGAVAVVFNLKGVNSVQISRDVYPKIFSGEIKNWKQVDRSLPNKPIRVVVRADGSGTTEIFTSHLSAISPSFRAKVGASKEPNWGFQVLKGPKNDGVAALVKQTDGAIGYVQDTYARKNDAPGFKTAKLQNKKGRFVEPSLAEANKSLSGARFNADFTANVDDPADGYPIVGITWLLLRQTYEDPQKAAAVKALAKWILTTGQGINAQLEYTRIPAAVTQRAVTAVDKIK